METSSSATTVENTSESSISSPLNLDEEQNLYNSFKQIIQDTESANTVKEVLSTKAAEGKIILNYYKDNCDLLPCHRNSLAKIIIHNEFEVFEKVSELTKGSQKFTITTQRFKELVSQLLEIFPTEKGLLYYGPYDSTTKQNASGKLWESFCYLKKKLKASRNSSSFIPLKTIQEDIKLDLDFLQKNFEPLDEIKAAWLRTVETRKDESLEIHEYFKKYPVVTGKIGPELINIDFQSLYPGKDEAFENNWEGVNSKLIALANKKEDPNGILSDLLKGCFMELTGVLLLPHLLPCVFHNQATRVVTGVKRKKLQPQQMLDGFMVLVENHCNVKDTLTELKKKAAKKKTTLQPIIVIVGESFRPEDVKSCHVFVNDVMFDYKDSMAAIKGCLKAHMVFNAKYNNDAAPLWTFIQHAAFEIFLPNDKRFTTVEELISATK
ncbi:uncharacterized protein LOC129800961 [Phlebotomus papatasi]|uniref:uncharacterized protein LOC129800961 n=1 Tax=Phlebotomus papatasi TaxID=29031 RepID=UPI002483FB86|nr:uncharacterized protein LOC129800961 [Phlebotomus papatasi]